MDKKLKQEILAYIKNVEIAMRAYDFALHSRHYVDVGSHENHINKVKQLAAVLKQKVEKSE
jgi:hypothetical protein